MENPFVFRFVLPAVLVMVMLGSVALSSGGHPPVFVKGTVTRTRKPLRSAWVIVSQVGQEKGRSLTGDDGKYYIGNLTSGAYDVAVVNGKKSMYRGRVTLPTPGNFNIAIP